MQSNNEPPQISPAAIDCAQAIRFVSEASRLSLYGEEAKDAKSSLLAMNYMVLRAREILRLPQ